MHKAYTCMYHMHTCPLQLYFSTTNIPQSLLAPDLNSTKSKDIITEATKSKHKSIISIRTLLSTVVLTITAIQGKMYMKCKMHAGARRKTNLIFIKYKITII